jgi:hypothetical protein
MNRGCRSLEEVLAGPVEINRDSPQAAGLVVDYPGFASRGMNKLRDVGGRGLDGTFNGGLTWGADARMGAALTFNGSTGYISWGAGGGLPIYSGTTPYSLGFWIKGAAQSNKIFYGEGTSVTSNSYFMLASGFANTSRVRVAIIAIGATLLVAESTTVAFDSAWHHVCWVDAAGAAQLYIDGVLDATNFAYTPAAIAPLNMATIGVLRYGGSFAGYFSGSIATAIVSRVKYPPPAIWQMSHAPTTWDLYRPVARFWPGFVGGAVSISPDLASLGGATGVSIGGGA